MEIYKNNDNIYKGILRRYFAISYQSVKSVMFSPRKCRQIGAGFLKSYEILSGICIECQYIL